MSLKLVKTVLQVSSELVLVFHHYVESIGLHLHEKHCLSVYVYVFTLTFPFVSELVLRQRF